MSLNGLFFITLFRIFILDPNEYQNLVKDLKKYLLIKLKNDIENQQKIYKGRSLGYDHYCKFIPINKDFF